MCGGGGVQECRSARDAGKEAQHCNRVSASEGFSRCPMSLWLPCGLHGFAVPNTVTVTAMPAGTLHNQGQLLMAAMTVGWQRLLMPVVPPVSSLSYPAVAYDWQGQWLKFFVLLCAAGHLEHSHVHDDDPDGHHHDMHDSARWVKGARQCMPEAQHSQQHHALAAMSSCITRLNTASASVTASPQSGRQFEPTIGWLFTISHHRCQLTS